MWFSVVCTLIDNDTRHHSGQEVVDSRGADVRANIFQLIDIFLILLQSDHELLVCEMQRKKRKHLQSPTSLQRKSVWKATLF